jgi:hypothetical protein
MRKEAIEVPVFQRYPILITSLFIGICWEGLFRILLIFLILLKLVIIYPQAVSFLSAG